MIDSPRTVAPAGHPVDEPSRSQIIAGGVKTVRHESALGWWELASRAAHPRLRGFARGYTGYRENTVVPVRHRQLPSGNVMLIVSFGETLQVSAPARSPVSSGTFTSFVAGFHQGPAITQHRGHQHHVGVELTPLGAYAVFGVPMHELTNAVVGLDGLLGPTADALVAQLAGAPTWMSRFALLDGFLAAKVRAGPQPSPAVVWAWERLRETAGQVSIAALAEDAGWSRRHLAARFREEVGVPPKVIARVLRFQRALELLGHAEAGSWADLAQQCGFADQPHLNREVRALAGCTPTELFTDGPLTHVGV